MITPIINMDVVSIPVNIQIMHVKHPVGHGQTEQRIKLDTLSYREKIVEVHIYIQHTYIVILKKIIE